MAEAPVGGRDTETGTGRTAEPAGDTAKPGRIPVSEVPEVEPDQDEEETAPEAGAAEEAEPEPEPEDEPEDEAEAEPDTATAGDEAGETGPAGAGQAPEPAAEPVVQSAAKPAPKPGKAAFDVFASPAGHEPIPVSEAPDLEDEAEEAETAAAGQPGGAEAAGPGVPAQSRVPISEILDVEPDEDEEPDVAETMFVPTVGVRAGAPASAEPAAEPEAEEPGPSTAEPDETTLIPKVTPEKSTESTTVMPSVASPSSDMARRPYGSAPSGYGSARQEWGKDLPDAQPTRVQPRIPSPASGGAGGSKGGKSARGYQPPEFRAVDPQRSELPPPQNFKLDRREVEGEQDGKRHIGRRALLMGGAIAVAAAGGLVATGKVKLPGTTPKTPPTVGFAPATNSGASAATQTGTAFLTAWQNNQLEAAANLTDNPSEALAALQAYHKNLGVQGITMNPNAANGVGWMTFAITTEAGTPMGQWQYQSGFATYAKQIDGFVRWFVQWSPQILYTSLKKGYELQIMKTPASVKGLVDRNGTLIDPTEHPSLAGIISVLTKKAVVTGATDGQDIIMVDAKGNQLASVTTLTPPIDNGTVKTTFDMKVQSACEAAVVATNAAMVAIEPSSGHILAVTNHTSEYYDEALLAGRAPGSTFKIITSTALLHNGLTTTDSEVQCPPALNVENTVLHNSEGEAGDYTYLVDFADSCNNAFSSFWNQGVSPNMLADTAKTFYGLNQNWDIGLGEQAQYMTVPGGLTGALLAESLVGQGNILSCPLAMCSVAATVANGSFKQPILLPTQQQITATPLGSKLQGDLKALMASVITEGTAAGVTVDSKGFPKDGHFFAKTGTAETGPQSDVKNDSWFVVFDDSADICLGALAVDGGYGAATAAPECLKVFQQLGLA